MTFIILNINTVIKMYLLKNLMIAIGIACLISNSLVLFYTFFIAYLNDYQVLININNFGEAHFEFIFIPISIILGLYSVIALYKLNLKSKKQTQKINLT